MQISGIVALTCSLPTPILTLLSLSVKTPTQNVAFFLLKSHPAFVCHICVGCVCHLVQLSQVRVIHHGDWLFVWPPPPPFYITGVRAQAWGGGWAPDAQVEVVRGEPGAAGQEHQNHQVQGRGDPQTEASHRGTPDWGTVDPPYFTLLVVRDGWGEWGHGAEGVDASLVGTPFMGWNATARNSSKVR